MRCKTAAHRFIRNLGIVFLAVSALVLGPACRADAFWVRASGGADPGGYPPGINGDGTDTGSTTPVWTLNAADTIAIDSGGSHNIILKSDGTVWCWGINSNGVLGDGTTNPSNVPVQVLDPSDPSGVLTGVIAVSGGLRYNLVLKADGTVWGWGRGSNLGNTTVGSSSFVPVQVMDLADPTGYLTGIKDIAASSGFALALKENGTVFAWGNNNDGELGNGTFDSQPTAEPVINPSDPSGYLQGIKAVSGADDHVVALAKDGTLWSWGSNSMGQLGDPAYTGAETPVPIHVDPAVMSDVAAVSVDYVYTLVLRADGTIWGCGENDWGELGDGTGTSSTTWVRALTPPGMKGLATSFWGGGVSLAVGADGSAWSWGYGSNGAMGNGQQVNTLSPLQVLDPGDPSGYLQGVLAVSSTAYNSIFLTAKGAAKVSSIAMTTEKTGKRVTATAAVTVTRDDGTPLAGAVVSGHWSGLTTDTDTGTTGADGTVALTSDRVRNPSGTFTFTIDAVSPTESLVWDMGHSATVGSIPYP